MGANNSGKTALIETIAAFNGDSTNNYLSFPPNQRCQTQGSIENVNLYLKDDAGRTFDIISKMAGLCKARRLPDDKLSFYIVPARRSFPYEFDYTCLNHEMSDRGYYATHLNHYTSQRKGYLDKGFIYRILKVDGTSTNKYVNYLETILDTTFIWSVEQKDNGKEYICFLAGAPKQSVECLGDGVWSAFVICDALYDAKPGDTIVIDEPELSLHPSAQKKLMNILLEESKDKQIILSTHSPYFINWTALINGANLVHLIKQKDGSGCCCFNLSKSTKEAFKGMINDIRNPHVLGIDANEVFFLGNKLILVEGQDDVVIFDKIQNSLNKYFKGEFFGWGVGGAEKAKKFLKMFSELGYEKIAVILDGDKRSLMEELQKEFPQYYFYALPTDDIRDKAKRKSGITFSNGIIKEEYKETISNLIDTVNTYFIGQNAK